MWSSASDTGFEERMIWVCVLRRAVFDYVLYKGRGKHKCRWQRAAQFIFDPQPADRDGLGFTEICSLFGWDPDYLRRLTRSLTRDDIKKLETNKYRDDLDGSPMQIIASADWSGFTSSVPFFTPYNYNKDLRQALELYTISEERPESFAPLVWAGV